MNEQLEFLRLIASRLDAAGIPYMLTGSMAMSVYVAPRMTRDLDFVVECNAKDAQRFVELFSPDCYVDSGAVREAIRDRRSFNIIHNEWIAKADFIVRKDSDYRRTEFGRRRSVDMGGWSMQVVTAEDLLLTKLQWWKDGSSELHHRDAALLASQAPDLDWDYVRSWADKLGLAAALAEVGPR